MLIYKKFCDPLPERTSLQRANVGSLLIEEVFQYMVVPPCGESVPVAQSDSFSEIKNVDPYAEDPYDQLVQVKHQFNSLCIEFMQFNVFTSKELNAIVQKEDRVAVLQEILTTRPVVESGIFRSFSFSKGYALRLSRETLLLIGGYREVILEGRLPPNKQVWLIFTKKNFSILRKIYTNIGKMHALVKYFEGIQIASDFNSKKPVKHDKTMYLGEVKEILLDLLEAQSKNQEKKFNTIRAALEGVQDEFSSRYENLKATREYESDQLYFDVQHLVRRVQTWQRDDAVFKKAASKYINLKH
ncbi:hypothetical protein [Comamonas sp. 4034]|uniref:hypothetical protein n=1 Tax=Comamonas sp. 4034 TaxID=3156455 RepID=UPI003D2605A5